MPVVSNASLRPKRKSSGPILAQPSIENEKSAVKLNVIGCWYHIYFGAYKVEKDSADNMILPRALFE